MLNATESDGSAIVVVVFVVVVVVVVAVIALKSVSKWCH